MITCFTAFAAPTRPSLTPWWSYEYERRPALGDYLAFGDKRGRVFVVTSVEKYADTHGRSWTRIHVAEIVRPCH